ncbi:hypothetical protein WAI453_008622 [Rhynchosporium graminicola]
MYRGEAANHGITDVQLLCERLFKVTIGESSQKEPINHCEAGMRERGSWAIIKSRQACLHAHDFKSVNKDSAILARSCQVLIYQVEIPKVCKGPITHFRLIVKRSSHPQEN